MLYDISEMASELKSMTEWQKTPKALTSNDYQKMIINGIKSLYIDTDRVKAYEELEEGFDEIELRIDEEKYVMIMAQIAFFNKVKTDVNNIVSYTTDALSITNADKPYANLKDSISELERERHNVFYKMLPFVFGTSYDQ